MLFESVRQSAAIFRSRKKAAQTLQQKLVFRWKFVALGLGVILIILIGICSELIRSLVQQKQIPLNTSFMYNLIYQSKFFKQDIKQLRGLIKALQQSQQIKFDNVQLLYSGSKATGKTISRFISGHQNILILMEYIDGQNPVDNHRVGIYLRASLPKINYQKQQNVYITDDRDSQYSVLFNLQLAHAVSINYNDACFIYSYEFNKTILERRVQQQDISTTLSKYVQQLSFLQLFHYSQDSIQGNIRINIQNYACFGKIYQKQEEKIKIQTNISKILGINMNESAKEKRVQISWMQVYQMNNKGMTQIASKYKQL